MSMSNKFHKIKQREWIRHRTNYYVNSPFQTKIYPRKKGISIPDADWDTLIILDACRADTFESVANMSRFDSYDRVLSRGSATNEWLQENFTETFDDIVYIAGTGQTSKHTPNNFVALEEPWRDGGRHYTEPHQITQAALEAHKKYPNKRVIVHYLQPHTPFIESQEFWYSLPPDVVEEADCKPKDYEDIESIWEALGEGAVNVGSVKEAYRQNLALVLEEAHDLASSISGRCVISSDHGNAFGERSFPIPVKVFGHPPGIRIPALTSVPWAVLDGERRKITKKQETSTSRANQREIEEQLDALGYK